MHHVFVVLHHGPFAQGNEVGGEHAAYWFTLVNHGLGLDKGVFRRLERS